ncbi:chemotaxis protein CheB [Alkalilimnicola ehrlichii]|uniref:chemotaxis protein CheB n=1 Tax=Alkalilimnicola ehrlichii TaxID=351052 RepID=UPI0015F27AAF|nr:chemotaxis protein CheB [Alkalilimnicola ehrlichii]
MRSDLKAQLEARSIEVVLEATLANVVAGKASLIEAEVLLLDLERAGDKDLDVLDELLEFTPVPMVFFDGSGSDSPGWWARFAEKLLQTVQRQRAAHLDQPSSSPALLVGGALRVWVLGASFGGPDALKRFFGALPDLPGAALIVGQHIGDGFVEVLAAQLNRAGRVPVVPAAEGVRLQAGFAYVAPVGQRVVIDSSGSFIFRPEPERLAYSPSINAIMNEVAIRFGSRSGAIVFTGMGDDGALGCRAIAEAGGEVWVQERSSCAIDSMPACAEATGAVRRSGPPEALAKALLASLTAS